MARSLRRAVDVVGVLMGLGVLAVVGLYGSRYFDTKRQAQSVAVALHEFDRVLSLQAASKQVELTGRGWPATIDPAWFLGAPPRNELVSPDRPWVEVATEEQADLLDPPLRIAAEGATAGFWYNPYRGVVRARVPLKVSERESVELYNRVNGRHVLEVYEPLLTAPPAEPEPEPETSPADAIDGGPELTTAPENAGV